MPDRDMASSLCAVAIVNEIEPKYASTRVLVHDAAESPNIPASKKPVYLIATSRSLRSN